MKRKRRYDYDDKNTVASNIKSADGKTEYSVMVDGSRRRTFPIRPWHGKSERRQVLKARRAASPFATLLREWRKKNDWYAKQAADKLGVPLPTYRGWEAGRHLPSTLAKNAIRACMKAYPGN